MMIQRSLLSIVLLSILYTGYYYTPNKPILLFLLSVPVGWDIGAAASQIKNNINLLCLIPLLFYSSIGTAIIVEQSGTRESKQQLVKIILLVASSDICQYLIGKYFGSWKFGWPSPNKTIEGYLSVLPLSYAAKYCFGIGNAVPIVFTGIIGDLFVSAIKRKLSIKDFSKILGEHGGWLDRMDSIFMVMIWLYITQYITT